jgi:hypothetical protein
MKCFLFALTILCISCVSGSVSEHTVTIEAKTDSCYLLQDSVSRKIEIIENTLDDTTILGLGVLPPGYTGEFIYVQFGTATDAAMYPGTPEELMPETNMFCINLYQKRPAAGYVVIRYKKR